MTEQKPILPCMGNPLLDICVVDDETLLKKQSILPTHFIYKFSDPSPNGNDTLSMK
ncbi:hypothetical protein C2G38_2246693 [Gigaspora rosea]|uniref:Uncharacterized protein n=1 Tax=Gigaspora rosea TaxID=44941 RepID=A0A397V356_9GLOM|nr:hypothetical protein C2G38_2246693 [Gigaspora rosea]